MKIFLSSKKSKALLKSIPQLFNKSHRGYNFSKMSYPCNSLVLSRWEKNKICFYKRNFCTVQSANKDDNEKKSETTKDAKKNIKNWQLVNIKYLFTICGTIVTICGIIAYHRHLSKQLDVQIKDLELRKQVLEIQRKDQELQKQVLEIQRKDLELRKQVHLETTAEAYVPQLLERFEKGIKEDLSNKEPNFGYIIANPALRNFLQLVKPIEGVKRRNGEFFIIHGQNNTGKTTAILNELKDIKNVILIKLRLAQEKGLTLEKALGQVLGIEDKALQMGIRPSTILFSAVEKIRKTGNQPIIIFEDIHTFISEDDYDKERREYVLPGEVRGFLNQCMQLVSENKAHFIITVSELSKKSCFGQLSGSGRLTFHRFERANDNEVFKMLMEVKELDKFGEKKKEAARLLTDKIGGDMGSLQKSLNTLLNAKFDANSSMEEIIDQSLSYPNNFSRFMNERMLGDSSGKLHHETKEALMAELLLRCASKSKKGSPLNLYNFFEALAEKEKKTRSNNNKEKTNNDVSGSSERLINFNDLKDSIHALERENLFLQISYDSKYEPHKRINVAEWKNKWISDPINQKQLNATRQAFLKQEKIEFPKPEVVDDVCQSLFGETPKTEKEKTQREQGNSITTQKLEKKIYHNKN